MEKTVMDVRVVLFLLIYKKKKKILSSLKIANQMGNICHIL